MMYEEDGTNDAGCIAGHESQVMVVAEELTKQSQRSPPFVSPNKNGDWGEDGSHDSTAPTTKETLPETPPQSESSSSSDSSHVGTLTRRKLHYSPQSIAYNPMTCHSPARRRRRHEIMGISILQLDKIRRHETEEDDEVVDDDDDLSEQNSEAALESASLQLRSELLTTEMLELAAEAERAAAAGQDHFAAQPCVFPDMAQPTMRRSYSEGTATRTASPPKHRRFLRRSTSTSLTKNTRRSRDKVSVVDLRDVHEVFPPFRQFHTHLRTHFFRGEVSQEQLYFDEPRKLQNPQGLFGEREITTIQSDGDMDEFRVHERLPPMLGSFRLNQWMRDPRRYAQGSVGELVSSHISTHVPGSVRHVDVPPGLENEQPGVLRHAPSSSSETTQVYSSSRVTDTSGNWGIGSLFQVDEPPPSEEPKDEVRAPECVAPESPPPAARTKAQDEEVRDFVTPVRLRKIRRPHRRKTYNRFLDPRRVVLPTNSLSEDSPQKKSPTTTPLLPLPSLKPRNESMQSLTALSPIEIIAPHDLLVGSEVRRSLTPTEMFPLAGGERTSSLRSVDRLGYSDNSLLESKARQSSLRCRSVSPSGSVIDLEMDDDDDDDEETSVDTYGPQRWNKPPSQGVAPRLPFATGNRTGRALYARSKENDDFMSNFLYCSSQPAASNSLRPRRDTEMWDNCGDGNFTCGEGHTGFCCAATLLHDALSVDMLFHGRPTVRKAAATTTTPTSTSSWVKLSTSGAATLSSLSSNGNRDADTSWFGMANGRIDAAFEHVLGSGSTSTTRSFRAPTLRKKQVIPMEEEEVVDEQPHYSFDIDEVSAAGRTSLLLEAQMAAA